MTDLEKWLNEVEARLNREDKYNVPVGVCIRDLERAVKVIRELMARVSDKNP